MTEVEVRAGDELERQLERYARVRLDPSSAQAKRARATVMEAAWRKRIADPAATPGESPVAAAAAAVVAPGARTRPRRGPFAGWGPRRLGVSFAAAVLAGLLVGSTAFAGSRAGGPLYEARLGLEELTLPTDAGARLEAELALAQGRLAEIVEAAAKGDPDAIGAAARGYVDMLQDLDDATGGPADRALLAVQFHRAVLLDVLERVPDDARPGIERALASSATVIDHLDAVGTTPTTFGGPGRGDGNPGTNAGGAGNGAGAKPATNPVPQKTAKPVKEPQPARSAAPVATQEARSPKPKPAENPDGESGAKGGAEGDQP